MQSIKTSRLFSICLLTVFSLLLTSNSQAQYPIGDTLTYILRPIVNIPSIVTTNSIFNIEVEAGESQDFWQGELLLGNLTYSLPIAGAYFLDGANRWLLTASVPDDIPLELYDLHIMSEGIDDTAKHAVKLIDDFRPDFYFIHITDSHMPSHTYYDAPGGLTDTSSMADLWSLVEDFEVINPEFVLFTGDVVNEGELEDFMELRCYSRSKNIISSFSVPVYVSSGNHDLGGWDETPPEDGTSRRDWWRFFGWKYLDQTTGPGPFTQDYFFDYGNIRLIELEAYINYDGWRSWVYSGESFTMLQKLWLSDVINATPSSKDIVTFNHYDFNGGLDIEGLGIDLNLYGHIHHDEGSIYSYPYNLATDNICDGNRSFRVIHYDETGFHPQPTFHAGSSGQNLNVNYSPPNDGTNTDITASIYNSYNFTFNHAQIVFNMPLADTFYTDYGTLWQIVEDGSIARCYVEFSLAANTTTSITIESEHPTFIPGDTNGDGMVIGSDVTYLVFYFAGNNPPPVPIYAGDTNGDCLIIGSDVTYLVNYFRGIGSVPLDGNCD